MTGSLATRGLYCNTMGAAPFASGLFCPGVGKAVKLALFGTMVAITASLKAGLEETGLQPEASMVCITPTLLAGLSETGTRLSATMSERGGLKGSMEEC